MIKENKRTGKWSFRTVVIRANGTKKRVSGTPGAPGRPYHDLPNSKAGAREAERRAINAAMNGKPLVATASANEQEPVRKTICEHAVTFVALYGPEHKPSTKRKRKVDIKHLLPWFGHIAPEGVKQTDVDAFVADEIKRGFVRKTINDRLGCLSTLMKYAMGQKPKLRLHVHGMRAEIRAVDPADVERLLVACNDDRHRAVILLASEAGLRAGEIRGLQWTDVKDAQLTVRRALDDATNAALSPKHDKVRNVPLSPRLTEALATLPRRGPWIVARSGDGYHIDSVALRDAIGAIYDRASVVRPPMLLHCLRHTFGTVMARHAPLPVLKELMGHEDIQTTMRYIDVNERDKRNAIALVFGERPDPPASACLVDPPRPEQP